MADAWKCPNATRHDPDRAGKCRWCGRKVEQSVAKPNKVPPGTELGDAYDQHYNPDHGTEKKRKKR